MIDEMSGKDLESIVSAGEAMFAKVTPPIGVFPCDVVCTVHREDWSTQLLGLGLQLVGLGLQLLVLHEGSAWRCFCLVASAYSTDRKIWEGSMGLVQAAGQRAGGGCGRGWRLKAGGEAPRR